MMHRRKKVGVIAAGESELLQLAREYDDDLKESGLADLESWQQEIRDYVQDGKAPGVDAEQQLRAWGETEGLIAKA
jgi:hypothetical protein